MKLNIDPEDLTLEELEVLEEHLDGSFDSAFSEGAPKAKALRLITWIILRRDNPEVTLEDAGRYKLADLDLGTEDDPGK
jgi:hypothetical protein